MFFERETRNPKNENYLSQTLGLKLYYMIYDSASTVMANWIFQANTPTSDLIIIQLE